MTNNDLEYGPESQPRDLEFRRERIDDYRVLTVLTNGAGIHSDFSQTPGLDVCIWLLYDNGTAIAVSNDTTCLTPNHPDKFGLPTRCQI